MAQVIDAAGRSKGFSKKKRQEPLHVPDRSSSGRVNHADYTGLAKGISNAVDKGASFVSSVARKANDQLMAPVSQERRMTVSPSFASAPRQEAPKMPEIRFNPDWHGLSDQQIDEIHEQETLGPAIIQRASDLYSTLNQPVEERPAVSYEELGRGASQAVSDVAGALNRPVSMSSPSPHPLPQSSQMSTSGMMGEPTAISASDMQMPEVGPYVPTSPKDRRRDWTSIMAPVANAANDAIDWLREESSAQVPGDDHAGRGDAWRSLGEAVGGPIDEHLRETQGYVAPRQDPTMERVSLPSVDQWSQMSEAGQFDRSTRTSPLQDLVNGVVSHWDEVQNYTAPEQDPTQPKVALPLVDGWTSMGDSGQFDNSPTVTPIQDLVDMAMDHWGEVQNYTAPEQDPTRQTKAFPTVDASQVGTSSQGLDIGDAEDVSKKLSQLTGIYVDPDMVGDTETNQSYEDFFIDNGASEEDVAAMSERDDADILAQLGEGTLDQTTNTGATGDAGVIDDGSSYDYNHVTSNWMTGTQYLRYIEDLGIQGRPVDMIDPRGIYNKQEELVHYGFVPYTPDWMSAIERNGANLMMLPGRVAGAVGNLRERITPDYTINVDGNAISGRDFDERVTPYIQQNIRDSQYRPMTYLMPPEDGRNATAYVNEWAIPSDDGTMTYHYGDPLSIDDGPDGTITASFSDGSVVTLPRELTIDQMVGLFTNDNVHMVRADQAHGQLPDDLSSLNDMTYIMNESRRSGISPLAYANVLYYPDLVLSDGTSISYEDAQRIYYDETPGDDDTPDDDGISYEFSDRALPFLFDNKPARFNAQEMISRGDDGRLHVDLSDIGNNAVDFTAGSLPISLSLPVWNPWVYSASSALASLAGVDPSSYDPRSGSYLPIAGYYDDDGNMRYGVQALMPEGEDWMALDPRLRVDQDMSDRLRYWNALGTAAVPFTEEIAGSVGGSDLIGNLLGVSDKAMEGIVAPTVGRLLARDLYGPVGEGLEEIAGNHFDELTNYGLQGMWADQAVDSEGRPMYDVVGRDIRDYGTPVTNRVMNAFDPAEMGNAFAGGMLVSGVMGAPGMVTKPFEYANARRRHADYVANGVAPYVEPEAVEEYEPSEEYLSRFDDQPAMRRTR